MKQPLVYAVVIALAGAVGFFLIRGTPGASTPTWCAEFAGFPSELSSLPASELERRVLEGQVYPPSGAKGLVDQLKARRDASSASERDCAYAAELLRMVVSEQHLPNMGETWGLTKNVNELKQLLLEQPLKANWSKAQREQALEWVEQHRVKPAVQNATDTDYWRRMYFGALLLCELTPEAFKALHVRRRPMDCPVVPVKPE